jgi:hypothetical protein
MHMPIRGFLMSTCGWVSTFGKQKTKSTNTRLCPIIIIIPILITRLCPISRGFARPFAFYNGGTGRNGVEGETGGGEGGGGGGGGGRGGLACLGMKVASSPSVEIAIRLAK